MNVKKVFCEECRNDVDYVVTTTPMTGCIKEKEYSYFNKSFGQVFKNLLY